MGLDSEKVTVILGRQVAVLLLVRCNQGLADLASGASSGVWRNEDKTVDTAVIDALVAAGVELPLLDPDGS